MAENEDGQEKSHDPTGKRLEDARRKGQVPRSRELNTMAVTLVGVAVLMLLAHPFGSGLGDLFDGNFRLTREELHDPGAMLLHLKDSLRAAFTMLLPFFAVMVTVAVLASIALGGFNLSAEALVPKFEKLNPIKGIKKVFSVNGLMELVKSLAKFVLIASATVALLWSWSADIIGLGRLDPRVGIIQGLDMLGWAALIISSTLILLALVDVPFQLWNHKRQLKMTLKEVRDEVKETEGRPEVKGRIRQLQRELAQRRMMEEVPKADVIVTNPTHFAVALRYDQDRMKAPIVVAKGSNLIAANIRRIGEGAQVPMVEAPALARAIYFSTELNDPIPAGLYMAVAQLLAYVFQLRAWYQHGGDIPQQPSEFPVPEELRHD